MTFGHSNNINHFVLGKEGCDWDFLFKAVLGKGYLFGNGAAVQLDFHDVGLFLTNEAQFADLGVGNDTDDLAVLYNTFQLRVDGSFLSVLFDVLCKGLLFGSVVVFVEPTLDVFRQVLGPDSGEGSETTWGFDVSK